MARGKSLIEMKKETVAFIEGLAIGAGVVLIIAATGGLIMLYSFVNCSPGITKYDLPHPVMVPEPAAYYQNVWSHDTCLVKGKKVICR